MRKYEKIEFYGTKKLKEKIQMKDNAKNYETTI
jgi:hypothetical protein